MSIKMLVEIETLKRQIEALTARVAEVERQQGERANEDAPRTKRNPR